MGPVRVFPACFSARAAGLVFVVAGPGLAGCTPWKVLAQSGPPSALAGVPAYSVHGDWTGVIVAEQDEPTFLAGLDDDERRAYADDKVGIDEAVLAALRVGAPDLHFGLDDAAAGLTVRWVAYEPGVFTGIYDVPTELTAEVHFTVGGVVTDELQLVAEEPPSMAAPTSGERARSCARRIGSRLARFLRRAHG